MTTSTVGNAALLRRFFSYYRPHRRLFALDFSCAVLSGVLELGFPLAAGLFVDELLPGGDWSLILLASLALLAVYLINTGLTNGFFHRWAAAFAVAWAVAFPLVNFIAPMAGKMADWTMARLFSKERRSD